jgi:RecB family endonuclease NucS
VPEELLFSVEAGRAGSATQVSLAEAGLRERSDLQEWIVTNPYILGSGLKIVTFEFDRWSSAAGNRQLDRLDVLALADDGRLVVAELKRDRAPETVEMQAIKYAAMASRFTPETLAEEHHGSSQPEVRPLRR